MQARIIALLAFLWPAIGVAHDFWLEPATYRPAANELVPVRIWVGEHYKGEAVPRNPERLTRFEWFGPGGNGEVIGRTGSPIPGLFRPTASGIYTLALETNNSLDVRLDAAKFESYLEHEGLTHITQEREKRGERKKEGTERYSRHAKAIVRVGRPESDLGFDKVIGLKLELVPMKNPLLSENLKALPVKVLFQGQALPSIRVAAINKTDPMNVVSGTTDATGIVTLNLSRPGEWLVKCVHMKRSPEGTLQDWESFWASLTFESS